MSQPASIPPDNWSELIRHILVGVDQQMMGDKLKAALQLLQLDTEEDAPLLLEAIGITQLLRKGARKHVKAASVAAPIAETGTPCSARSIQHLQAILNDHYRPALPEFSRLLLHYQKVLPPESIPVLLERCLQNAALWALLQPILGAKGHWLLQQHPQWSGLAPTLASAEGWHSASAKEQLHLFQQLRALAPAEARAQLLLHWPKLSSRDQARLLPAMAMKLSNDDEVFLETVLRSTRKEVRLPAAELLAQLPTSLLVQRLWQHTREALTLEKDQLVVTFPKVLPKATQDDGIYPTGSKMPGGLELNWLCQLVARTPFSFWEQAWRKSATEIVALLVKAPYSLPLMLAFTESLAAYPHPAGEAAFIKWWLLTGQTSYWGNAPAQQLLARASDEVFSQSLVAWLEQNGPLVPADSLPAYWLGLGTHQWEPALTKIVVIGFLDVIQNRQLADWNLYHYNRIFEVAGYQSDTQLLKVIKDAWFHPGTTFGRWHPLIEQMLQIFHFRQEIVKELARVQ